MINSLFKRKKDHYQSITVKGHALFGDYGTDIVCASVSTALIMTANAIEVLGYSDSVSVQIEEGFFKLEVKHPNEIVEGLMHNLFYTLDELATQYDSYIKNQKEG